MKKCLLKGVLLSILLFAGLFCELSVRSQSVIFGNGHHSEFSIVRNYTNNVDITYSVLVNEQCFNYVDRNTMTMLCAPLPSLFTVNDMEIYNDSVFFCGKFNEVAMYGYFDIYDLFFGLGNVRYFLASGLSGHHSIYSFRRLAVGPTPSGKTHMVMVGFGYYESSKDTIPKQRYYTPSVIADAWIDGSGANQFHYTVDQAEEHSFDDVIINEKWAIISARGTDLYNMGPHKVLYYSCPLSQNNSIFYSWISFLNFAYTPSWEADVSTFVPVGNVVLARMENGEFATACNETTSNKIILSIFTDPQLAPIGRYSSSLTDNVEEMVYNPLNKSFFARCFSLGGCHVLNCIPYPYTSIKSVSTSNCRWTSIDNADNDMYEILTGFSQMNALKKIWLYDDINPSACIHEDYGSNTTVPIYESSKDIEQLIELENLEIQSFSVDILIYDLFVDCR